MQVAFCQIESHSVCRFTASVSLSAALLGAQSLDVMDRATYRGNTHPIAAPAVVHWLPKDRRSRPSTGCPLLGRPVNRNCPIVPYLAATASDTPTMCSPLTEGELACRPFLSPDNTASPRVGPTSLLPRLPFPDYNGTCGCSFHHVLRSALIVPFMTH